MVLICNQRKQYPARQQQCHNLYTPLTIKESQSSPHSHSTRKSPSKSIDSNRTPLQAYITHPPFTHNESILLIPHESTALLLIPPYLFSIGRLFLKASSPPCHCCNPVSVGLYSSSTLITHPLAPSPRETPDASRQSPPKTFRES